MKVVLWRRSKHTKGRYFVHSLSLSLVGSLIGRPCPARILGNGLGEPLFGMAGYLLSYSPTIPYRYNGCVNHEDARPCAMSCDVVKESIQLFNQDFDLQSDTGVGAYVHKQLSPPKSFFLLHLPNFISHPSQTALNALSNRRSRTNMPLLLCHIIDH